MSDTPDIATLFARDPLSLSTQDLDSIITGIRKMRHTFNEGQRAPTTKSLKKPAKPSLGLALEL
jgi:hypothetical protein